MKYIVVIADGMADYPIEELNGKTPLEVAEKGLVDALASKSLCGLVKTVPEGMQPGSDIANLSLFGYDPKIYFNGRAPLEAVSMGIDMSLSDVAYRCNLVTFRKEEQNLVMDDYSAGHITTEEAKRYIDLLNDNVKEKCFNFFPGVSYRHLMIWKNGKWEISTTPPHDIPDKKISDFYPKGDGADELIRLMESSQKVFENSDLNKERIKKGKKPVSSIWLWGQGKKPNMPTLQEKYGIKGSVIAAVDLINGIGILAGLKKIKVPNVTGYIDTNFEGKAEYAVNCLENDDIVFVHIEACDETSHEGSLEKKLLAIKYINDRFLTTLKKGLDRFDNYRLLLVIDHPTPVKLKIHVNDPVPFLIYEKNKEFKGVRSFTEKNCSNAGLFIEEGFKIIDFLINGEH
ncbi:MAG: cofactor-independent phosphoglycerate mutase [Proteobacteria bacterium]|nr:cofactor-independent phosphoglycerate mutase [Pseudomonadota bacterium]